MSEHLTLKKALGKPAKVYLHESLFRPRAIRMDRFRYQLFSRTALAGNQDRGVCRGDT